MLFYSDFNANSLDSLQLHRDDFELAEKPIYLVESKPWIRMDKNWGFIFFILLSGIATGWWIGRKKRIPANSSLNSVELPHSNDTIPSKNDIPAKLLDSNSESGSIRYKESFSPIEWTVLVALIKKTSEQVFLTIDELNKLLGIVNKKEAIQKKIRSNTLQSINQKLILLLQLKQDAILKERSEPDKRSFTYTIDPTLLDRLEKS